MEDLVKNVILRYSKYVAEAELLEKWLSYVDDPSMTKGLSLLELKISAIKAWFDLLNADERFVIEKHLIEQMNWPRVAFEYRERWNQEFTRTERSLQIYQAEALAKIANFANNHREITLQLFGDVACTNYQPE